MSCSIDGCTNQWLSECCNEKMVMATTFEFRFFGTLETDISMNRFNYNLPPSIKHMTENKNNDTECYGKVPKFKSI